MASKFVTITAAQGSLLTVLKEQFVNPKGFFYGKGVADHMNNLEVAVYDTVKNDGEFGPQGWTIPNIDFHSLFAKISLSDARVVKEKLVSEVVKLGNEGYNVTQLNKDLHWLSRLCGKAVRYDAKTGFFGYVKRTGNNAGQVIWETAGSSRPASGGADPLAALELFGIAAATPPVMAESEAEKQLKELQALLAAQGISIEDLQGSSVEETPSSEQSE